MTVSSEKLKRIIEGVLMAANEPVTIARLIELFEPDVAPSIKEVQTAIEQLTNEYADRAVGLIEVANGFRFQVKEDLSAWVQRLSPERPQKYSRSTLEILALIAYRQPITRGEIEDIRGVATNSSIIKTLMDRGWVREVGHKDVPGKPALFATTKQFLDDFGLKSLDQLPTLAALQDLDSLGEQLGEQFTLNVAANDSENNSEQAAQNDLEQSLESSSKELAQEDTHQIIQEQEYETV